MCQSLYRSKVTQKEETNNKSRCFGRKTLFCLLVAERAANEIESDGERKIERDKRCEITMEPKKIHIAEIDHFDRKKREEKTKPNQTKQPKHTQRE